MFLSESGRQHLNHEHTIVCVNPIRYSSDDICYVIKCSCDGVDYIAPEWSLEPIQKRPEPGSWDEIEKATGWNPARGRVAV